MFYNYNSDDYFEKTYGDLDQDDVVKNKLGDAKYFYYTMVLMAALIITAVLYFKGKFEGLSSGDYTAVERTKGINFVSKISP